MKKETKNQLIGIAVIGGIAGTLILLSKKAAGGELPPPPSGTNFTMPSTITLVGTELSEIGYWIAHLAITITNPNPSYITHKVSLKISVDPVYLQEFNINIPANGTYQWAYSQFILIGASSATFTLTGDWTGNNIATVTAYAPS